MDVTLEQSLPSKIEISKFYSTIVSVAKYREIFMHFFPGQAGITTDLEYATDTKIYQRRLFFCVGRKPPNTPFTKKI